MAANALSKETSPYLLQHADNPVHWMAWGPEALAQARGQQKPILLSVGYAACHWCHVMAHESFENAETADLMNALFVNVKVDREERPDIDSIYQSALALLGQQGGWPLTMFLTPDGEPFWGGTYFPPEGRWGRPGFPDVLRAVAAAYSQDSDRIDSNVDALRRGLDRLADNHAGDGLEAEMAWTLARRVTQAMDPVWGGMSGAPKFPQASMLNLLWRAWCRAGDTAARDAVLLSLTRMSQGGLYDHLGGGYARYSTDDEWLAPHFEKMLYDNAQLLELLTLAWQETGNPLFEVRSRETVAWLKREMIAEGGGFAATLDADSEGEEGKFYVWSEAEIDAALGDDAPAFKQVYDVGPGGNWEGKTILNRRHQDRLFDADTETRLAKARGRLLAVRDGRIRPGWDDKVLADWNGLMIAALAQAGDVFGEADWIAAATRAFAFVAESMTEADGRLRQSWRAGTLKHAATLDAYAAMIRGALALHEVTGDDAYLRQAADWTAITDAHYWDAADGGYFFTADDAEALIVRTKTAYDNAVPNGNGMMLANLVRLRHLTGEDRYGHRAEALAKAFAGEAERNAFPLATLLNGAAFLETPVQIVVVGSANDPATRALRRTVLERSIPDRILLVVQPGRDLPAGHPAAGKGQVEDRATAYLCVGPVCRAPVTDPTALAAQLDGERPADV